MSFSSISLKEINFEEKKLFWKSQLWGVEVRIHVAWEGARTRSSRKRVTDCAEVNG
jgi:hypothetical protein